MGCGALRAGTNAQKYGPQMERPGSAGRSAPSQLWVNPNGFSGWFAKEKQEKLDYHGFNTIRASVTNGDVALLKGSWLQSYVETGLPIERRQEMPETAYWDPEAAMNFATTQWEEEGTCFIIAVSHCWLTPEHPDPEGANLRIVAAAAKSYMGSLKFADVAIFWDFCSLYQPDSMGHLPQMERVSFSRAFENMPPWYAGLVTMKFLLTRLPVGFEDCTAYADRGWTTFERASASMITPANNIVDLGQMSDTDVSILLEAGKKIKQLTHLSDKRIQKSIIRLNDELTQRAWPLLRKQCRLPRQPPLLPENFSELLETKRWSHASDHSSVQQMYLRTFLVCLQQAEKLNFEGLAWGDDGVKEFARVLFMCRRLQELDLSANKITDKGVRVLAEALPSCARLTSLSLEDNAIRRDGAEYLIDALPHCGQLRNLQLEGNELGKEATTMLQQLDFSSATLNVHVPEGLSTKQIRERKAMVAQKLNEKGPKELILARREKLLSSRGMKDMDHLNLLQ